MQTRTSFQHLVCRGRSSGRLNLAGKRSHTPRKTRIVEWNGCGATLIYNDIALSAAHVSDCDRKLTEVTAHSLTFFIRLNKSGTLGRNLDERSLETNRAQ
jgi:hypothetical protein